MQSPIVADSIGPIILMQPRAVAENADGIVLDLMPDTPCTSADRLAPCKKLAMRIRRKRLAVSPQRNLYVLLRENEPSRTPRTP